MLKIQVIYDGSPIVINLDSDRPNQAMQPDLEGKLSTQFAQWLQDQFGAFGHPIGDRITPIDLHYVIVSSGYQHKILEGADLVKSYKPEIPSDAVS